MARFYGRIIGGDRIINSIPYRRWSRLTIISAIRFDGSTISMTNDGSTDRDIFKAYINEFYGKN